MKSSEALIIGVFAMCTSLLLDLLGIQDFFESKFVYALIFGLIMGITAFFIKKMSIRFKKSDSIE